MKRVIKLLLRADHKVTSEDLYRADRFKWRASTKKLLKQAIDELQAASRWETPEQYKKRTGEDWPDKAAVYCCGQTDEFAKQYDPLLKKPNGYLWMIMGYGNAKNFPLYKMTHILCATEAGLPPEDWKPEEAVE